MEPAVYAKMYAHEDNFWWHAGIRRIIAGVLDRQLPERTGRVILDAGCGTGGMFGLLAGYGVVYGVDCSPEAVGYARARRIAREVWHTPLDALPFPDDFFDAVVCFDVLYHEWVENQADALHEIHRVLKPGGVVLVREAAYNWLYSQHDEVFKTARRFTRKSLTVIIHGVGFRIIQSSYVGFLLFPAVVLKRFAWERLWPQKNPIGQLFATSLLDPLFALCLRVEAYAIRYMSFPFGLSIICVAKKEN